MAFNDLCFIVSFILFSIAIGIVGFRVFCNQEWYNAFCYSTSTLSYSSVMTYPDDIPGKAFCCIFSLYATVVFLIIIGILIGSMVDLKA